MKENAEIRKKFLTIRVSEEEEKQIIGFQKSSTCRSLSEYARAILLKKPVTFYTRNKSADEILSVLIGLKKDFNGIGNNFNQAVKKLHMIKHDPEYIIWIRIYENIAVSVAEKIEAIKKEMIKIAEQWLQRLPHQSP
jgi:hypothetical protein